MWTPGARLGVRRKPLPRNRLTLGEDTMPILEIWNNVPAGSTLHVTLSPAMRFGITGTHTVNTGNGPVLRGGLSLDHFPLEIPVGGADRHMVEFSLLWTGADADVSVAARVEEGDGSTFQEPVTETAQLNAGSKVESVTLIANG
jgi:hypothetical protein